MKKMALFMAGLMVLIAFSVSVSAGLAAPQEQMAAQQQSQGGGGSISGTCYQFKIGYPRSPLAGVSIYYGGAGVADGRLDIALGVEVSDENGCYTISDLAAPGIYGLFAFKQRFIPWGHIVQLTEENPHATGVDFTLIKIPGN